MDSKKNHSHAPRSRLRRWFSSIRWVGLFFWAMIPVSRWMIFETDHQFANLATMGLGVLGTVCFYVGNWIALAERWIHHLVFLLIPILAACMFFVAFRFVGFTGETLPVFRARWNTKEIVEHPNVPVPSAEIKQSTTNENTEVIESLQFLGNQRNGVLSSPSFETGWDQKLPRVLWKHSIGAGWAGFVVSRGLAITLEQSDQFECLSAYDLKRGNLVWQTKFPGRHFDPFGGLGPRSTPSIVDDLVYAQTALGILCCVQLQTGNVVWQKDLLQLTNLDQATSEKSITWGRSGSPLILGNQLIVPLGGKTRDPSTKTLLCVDRKTGDELWRNGNEQISYASPVALNLCGVPTVVSVNENCATGHNPANGDMLWRTDWPSNSNADACASQPVQLSDRRILLGKGYASGSKVIELEFQGSESEWYNQGSWKVKDVWNNTRVVKTKFTSGLFFEGYIYALSDGILECVDPANGNRVWRGKRYGQGQAIIVNGHILVGSEDGRVAIVPASPGANGTPLNEMQVLEGITWNIPTVAGPYLLIRNGEEAACLYSGKDSGQDAKNSLQ